MTEFWTSPGPALTAATLLASGWMVLGFAGLLRLHSVEFVGRVLFPLGALLGLLLALVAFAALFAAPASMALRNTGSFS